MNGRNGNRVTQTEVIEFIEIGRKLADRIALINAENNGLAAFLHHRGNLHIGCNNARADIRNEDNNLGTVDGKLSLPSHLLEDNIVRLRFDTARIDKHKVAAEPFAVAVNSVPCNTGGIVDDGKPCADEFIEKS